MRKIITVFAGIAIIISCHTKQENKTIDETSVHPDSMSELFPTPKVSIKTVGIFLYEGYTSLDAMGPYSVFTNLMGTKVFFIAKNKGVVKDGAGLKVQVDTSIDEVKQLDILLIPGGLTSTYLQTQDTTLLNWIRSIDRSSTYTTSVCTGAWILGAAGLLNGKEATTHWYGKKMLAEQYRAKVQNSRYTHSGKYWTSAGVSAGIDMSLSLLNEIAGKKYTKAVMLNMEYDPKPPFKGSNEIDADKNMVEGMRVLYDEGMKTALHPETVLKDIKIDNGKDFVCGMSITTGIADTVHYKGKVYGFCSSGCRDEFQRNPLAYVSE